MLAVDPGFKSGCKLAALDEFGNLLDQAVIHLVGREEGKVEGRQKLVELIKQHKLEPIPVAADLANTPTVCRKSYINPIVFDAWRCGRLHDSVAAIAMNAPRKLVLITTSQSSIDIRIASPSRVTPALFTRMSILVKSARICAPLF